MDKEKVLFLKEKIRAIREYLKHCEDQICDINTTNSDRNLWMLKKCAVKYDLKNALIDLEIEKEGTIFIKFAKFAFGIVIGALIGYYIGVIYG